MKISIVTPSFNQRDFLRQTLDSILRQRGEFEIESIVMDGGSTDGTVEYLKAIDDPRLTWRSEKDRGQSDALNKGLAMASGEIVGWLNSDDLYVDGALAAVIDAFKAHPDKNWLVGRCDIVDENGREIRQRVTRYKNWALSRYTYRRLLRENCISQPAVFWRREFGRSAGAIDESLHHAMDYDLWLRMGRAGEPIILDRLLSHFRMYPTSKSGASVTDRFDEGVRVAERYYGSDWQSRVIHRLNVAKIVWSYRVMKLLGK